MRALWCFRRRALEAFVGIAWRFFNRSWESLKQTVFVCVVLVHDCIWQQHNCFLIYVELKHLLFSSLIISTWVYMTTTSFYFSYLLNRIFQSFMFSVCFLLFIPGCNIHAYFLRVTCPSHRAQPLFSQGDWCSIIPCAPAPPPPQLVPYCYTKSTESQ